MPSLALCVIMGLAQNPAGKCLGLRALADSLAARYPIAPLYYTHFGSVEPREALAHPRIMIVGHSFGGWDAIGACNFIASCNRWVDALCLLDPKPEGIQWINPFYRFTRPPNVAAAACFRNWFGRPFDRTAPTVRLPCAHDAIPAAPEVAAWIEQTVAFLTADPSTAV